MLRYVRDDIFASPAQTLVNTVNTVGVMGKGIAAEFKRRFPEMFTRYERHCKAGTLTIGKLYLYRSPHKWVLNFPTKQHWRNPSHIEWIESGLQKFVDTYEQQGITSIAFPQLGCGNGGLDWGVVKPVMDRYLKQLPIPIFVHTRLHSRDFIPEHEDTAREAEDLLAPRASVSFSQFITDLMRLLGQPRPEDIAARLAADNAGDIDGFEPMPPPPRIAGHKGPLEIPWSELEVIWSKLVRCGGMPLSALSLFDREDAGKFAEMLGKLEYVRTMSFVSGSYAEPLIEPGIRYVPPAANEVGSPAPARATYKD